MSVAEKGPHHNMRHWNEIGKPQRGMHSNLPLVVFRLVNRVSHRKSEDHQAIQKYEERVESLQVNITVEIIVKDHERRAEVQN